MSGGVLNYGHMARHGQGTQSAFDDARRILQRDYTAVVQRYVTQLCEGAVSVERERPHLCALLADTAAVTLGSSSRGSHHRRRLRMQEWKDMQHRVSRALREDGAVMRRTHTGLYLPHHALLADWVARAADRLPQSGDVAHLLRHGLNRVVLREKMRAATEVHFNALASLRWSASPSVRVGDWVMCAKGGAPKRGDVFEGTADHIPGSPTSDWYEDWTGLAEEMAEEEQLPPSRSSALHETDALGLDEHSTQADGRGTGGANVKNDGVSDAGRKQDARETILHDRSNDNNNKSGNGGSDEGEVGKDNAYVSSLTHTSSLSSRQHTCLLNEKSDDAAMHTWSDSHNSRNGNTQDDEAATTRRVSSAAEAAQYRIEDVVLPLYGRDMATVLPAEVSSAPHSVTALYHSLAEELQLTGLTEMRSAERAGVRRLCVRPQQVACYIQHAQQGWEWLEGEEAAELQKLTYTDEERVLRVRSPLMSRTGRAVLSRRGIVGKEQRRVWCKPARPETSGMTCVLRFTVPRGTPATSVLREVFQITTISPSAIFRLLC